METEKFIWVFLGSGLGGVVRFIISLVSKYLFPHFPLGTLLSNLLGMFLIGYLFLVLTDGKIPWREFLLVGFLGGLTTFSTFGNDTYLLFMEERYGMAFFYVLANLFLGLLLLHLGRMSAV